MKFAGWVAGWARGFFVRYVPASGVRRGSLSALLLAALPSLASAATINVAPGAGTLQAAIDAANPGDVLRLVSGTMGDPTTSYGGPVVVTKRVKIQGGKTVSVIDAGCASAVAFEVTADGVQLRNLAISGGTTTGLRVAGRSGVKLQNMGIFAGPSCPPSGAGIDLDGVVRLSLKGVHADRFPTGISVAHLAAAAHVKLDRCGGEGNPFLVTGVLITDVQPGTLKLTRCQSAFASDAGVVLQSADGVRVEHSVISGFPATTRGIVVDADSDDNLFRENEFQQDMVDVVDDGTSNCWKRNVQTFPPGPVTGNPSTAGCD